MNIEGVTCVAIMIICYLIGIIVKVSALNDKWIPCVVGICGGIIGVAAMYVMPGYPANDIISAFAIGAASGLASTGADQPVKQLMKGSDDDDEDNA